MDASLIYILIATGVIALGHAAGLVTLAINEQRLRSWLLYMVALSAGALMTTSLTHLLPEAVALSGDAMMPYYIVLASFAGFFLLEKIIHWHHCHGGFCETNTLGVMNLIGDFIHNIIDGLIVAAAFLADVKLGVLTATAVAMHEIPQEIGDFGVLLYSGFGKWRALASMMFVSLGAIGGGVLGWFLSFRVEYLVVYLLPVAAGGFIYIAASDLMPEIRHERSFLRSVAAFLVFLFGSGVILGITSFI